MQILKDTFLDDMESAVSLRGKNVLEIGCGNGTRSVKIAERSRSLVAIEPTHKLIERAGRLSRRKNLSYVSASALSLPFQDWILSGGSSFDLVFFTLSLHHIEPRCMARAIKESASVAGPGGYIVFFEPTLEGSFYEAEIRFDACDGDESAAKELAHQAILACELERTGEMNSETIFGFRSLDDFLVSMQPKKNLETLPAFLDMHRYALHAMRRINIFLVPHLF